MTWRRTVDKPLPEQIMSSGDPGDDITYPFQVLHEVILKDTF